MAVFVLILLENLFLFDFRLFLCGCCCRSLLWLLVLLNVLDVYVHRLLHDVWHAVFGVGSVSVRAYCSVGKEQIECEEYIYQWD